MILKLSPGLDKASETKRRNKGLCSIDCDELRKNVECMCEC